MKRTQLNLLLGIVAMGLVAAVYLSQEKPEPPPPPLTTLADGDISHIVIRHAGHDDIRLEKRQDGWWLVGPVQTRAEAIEVAAILGLASRESQRRYAVAEMDLATMGLAEPAWSVQLNETRIEFGETDPIEARRYVRLGDTVHLIEDPPSAALDAEYHDLVAKRLLPEKATLSRIVLPGLSLNRNDRQGWQVTPPAADRGADAAQQLVNAWQQAQAMWVTPLERGRTAQGSVTIRAGNETFRFDILDREQQLVLARSDLGVQFTLSKTLDGDLFELKPPAQPIAEPADTPTRESGSAGQP